MSKLIEKEGRFYKECRIVMLESRKADSVIIQRKDTKALLLFKQTQLGPSPVTHLYAGNIFQHLYITSDDEIKDGDWFMSAFFSYPIHNIEELREREGTLGWTTEELNKDFKGHKIITSTDISLGLPSPSGKFIQAYIDAYNKGEKIEKVLVKCEELYASGVVDPGYVPKLIIKDNNIIIKKVKDSWNREEVAQIIENFSWECTQGVTQEQVKKWIEENL